MHLSSRLKPHHERLFIFLKDPFFLRAISWETLSWPHSLKIQDLCNFHTLGEM